MMGMSRCALALFVASVAFAQPASRTFHLTTVTTAKGLNEVATILRTVGDMKQIHADDATFDITVSDGDLDLAAWIVKQVDTEEPKPAQYEIPGTGDVVRVLCTAHSAMPAMLNELVTSLRTVADIQRIFTYNATYAILIRTTAAKADLATWLVKQLDTAPDDQTRWQLHQYQNPDPRAPVVRVIYLVHSSFGPNLNEILTNIRVIADVQKIFSRTPSQGIVFATTPEQAKLADWLIQQLDVLPDSQMRATQHEYPIPGATGDVARIYYLKSSDTSAQLNEMAVAMRSETQVRKIFTCTQPRALALRGTSDAMEIADRLIKQRD